MENAKQERERETREIKMKMQHEGGKTNTQRLTHTHTHTVRLSYTQRHIISSRRDGKCQTFCPNAENLHAKLNRGTVRE